MESYRPEPVAEQASSVAGDDDVPRSGERRVTSHDGDEQGAVPAASASSSGQAGGGDEVLAALEPALARGDWPAVCAALDGADPATLSPAASLIHATARGETAGESSATDASLLAIASVARLFEISADSRLAVVIAKRIMRTHPVRWHRRRAPRAPVRMALVLGVLALGVVVGWLLGPEIVRLEEILRAVRDG